MGAADDGHHMRQGRERLRPDFPVPRVGRPAGYRRIRDPVGGLRPLAGLGPRRGFSGLSPRRDDLRCRRCLPAAVRAGVRRHEPRHGPVCGAERSRDRVGGPGYETGPLGLPISGLICGLKDSGCGQVFQGGRVYSSPGAGVHAVGGAIQSAWIAQGWEAGRLGYPSGDQVCGLAGNGCKQDFQGGTLYSNSSAGAHAVSGDIGTASPAVGGAGGALGYPTTGLICGLRNGGCGQVFEGGRIYQGPGTGAHAVSGGIQGAWIAQGWETGPLGYPSGDQVCGLAGDGCKQTFQGGTLYSSTAAGNHALSGAIASAWTAAGAEGGPLGYPTTGLICGLRTRAAGRSSKVAASTTRPPPSACPHRPDPRGVGRSGLGDGAAGLCHR